MQTYRANFTCRVPVGLGFPCGNEDTQCFSYAGDPLTLEHVEEVVNEQDITDCWQCGGGNWKVTGLTPIAYRASAEIMRT